MKYDFDLENHKILHKKLILRFLITIVEVAAVIFAAYLITHFGLEKMTVSGEYMNPTLDDGDNILINKMSYKLFKIKRNDVVVMQQNGSGHSYYTIGRIIGLPGETIRIEKGSVYIDGNKLKEKFDFPEMENGGLALEDITLDAEEYFMLCDNRNEGEDSRNANIGNIMRSDIIGKAWIRTNSFAIINSIDEFENGE